MAPKTKTLLSLSAPMKGKAKTKAKGKAKAKGKGKGNVVKHVADAEGQADLVIAKKAKAPSLKAQVLRELGEKSFDEVMGEKRKIGAMLDEQIDQRSKVVADALQKKLDAQTYFEEVQTEVAAAEEKELEAMSEYKSFATKRGSSANAKEDARKDFLEATRALAMMEVMADNRKKVQELEQKRFAAQEAAEAAKQRLDEQKAAEREATEATRKSLLEQRAKAVAEKEAMRAQDHVQAADALESHANAAVRQSDDLD